MADVVDLDAHRDQPYRCGCGSTHFRLVSTGLPPAITLSRDGSIATYAGSVVCDECGEYQNPPISD